MSLTQVNSAGIVDGTIVNADINSSAAIALSKLASTPAVLTGSTNNTITTVTAANSIQGEANLTFSGTQLTIGSGSSSVDHYLNLSADTGTFILKHNRGNHSLELSDSDGTGDILAIDTSGRISIGYASSINSYGENSQLQVSGTGYADSTISIRRDSSDDGSGSLILSKSRGSQGGVTAVQSGDKLGSIVWCGADGTDANSSAGGIQCVVDGTPSVNDMPGRLEFYTTNDGAGGISEKMRLKSNGELRVGSNSTTASTAGDDLVIEGSSDRGLSIISGNFSSSNIYFGRANDADVGRIAYQQNDNALEFSVNAGSTALRIASGGQVDFAYKTNTAPPSPTSGGNEGLQIYATRHDSSNFLGTIDFVAGRGSDNTNGGAQMRFFTQLRAASTNPAEALRITADGVLNGRALINREFPSGQGNNHWTVSGSWKVIIDLASYPDSCLYICDAAMQYSSAYTATFWVYKTQNDTYQVVHDQDSLCHWRINGSQIEIQQNSGADQTDTSGYQKVFQAFGMATPY